MRDADTRETRRHDGIMMIVTGCGKKRRGGKSIETLLVVSVSVVNTRLSRRLRCYGRARELLECTDGNRFPLPSRGNHLRSGWE